LQDVQETGYDQTPDGEIKVSEGDQDPIGVSRNKNDDHRRGWKTGSFEIKGITNYEGKEVCESQWNSDEGSMTQYFMRIKLPRHDQ